MSYIFISFVERLDTGSCRSNELYNLSLNEQYKLLQKRIPLERQLISLNAFIESCFPSGLANKYYISYPNFLRNNSQDESNKSSYINNVVMRPELFGQMEKVLPDNKNIILIGDINKIQDRYVFIVKGIQLIDSEMSSINDMVVNASICSSFKRDKWSIFWATSNDSFFTPNQIYRLINSCYTVENPEKVLQTYEEWKKYIDFRKYYLDEQSKRNFKLDSCEFINAFEVDKKRYRNNQSIFDDYILDGHQEFEKGDMVIISSKIDDAEPFPLIRLNIDRNKKEFNKAKISVHKKLINEEEKRIKSLARDNVFISSKNPNDESNFKGKNGKTQKITTGELLNSGYALGDRYKIVSFEIEPKDHLKQLDKQFEDDVKKEYEIIDDKYDKIIQSELTAAVESYKKETDLITVQQLKQKEDELFNSLETDVAQNNDSSISSKISKKKKELKFEITNKLKKEEKEKDYDFENRLKSTIERAYSTLDLHAFYKARNLESLKQYSKNADQLNNKKIIEYKDSMQSKLSNKYAEKIRIVKMESKERLDAKLRNSKNKAIEDETIIRFSLYFKLSDLNYEINTKQIETINQAQYIVYDDRAENAKITRYDAALNNFFSGFVMNPYLSTYLFNPEMLSAVKVEDSEWNWYLESLNDKQKEAVRKAVYSNGIFLLQGPPGTGKTQVIAETVAHLVTKGQKVLISSETHKAIDNVFERLPKIADIVPIRLIPSKNDKKNKNEYDPKFLVDNFYLNISSNMKKAVKRYKNFKKNKEEFRETFDKLNLLKSKIEKSQKILDLANNEIADLDGKAKGINLNISSLIDKKNDIISELDILKRTRRHIDKDNLSLDDDIKTKMILDYLNEITPLFDENKFTLGNPEKLLKILYSINSDEIENEILRIDPESNNTILEIKKQNIKRKMNDCLDELGDIIPGKEAESKSLKSELVSTINQMKETEDSKFLDLKLSSIFNYDFLANNLSSIKVLITEIKDKIFDIKVDYIEKINNEVTKNDSELHDLEREITKFKNEINKLNESIMEIQDRQEVRDIQENKYRLKNELNIFFKDFEISQPFNDIDEALKIIDDKWRELEKDYKRKELENKEKIPMYEKISNYLSKVDVIDADRKEYTRDLMENANVFGITCTSREKFNGKNVDALSEYGIDDIDIKTVGIDVVIIDEVSKLSFIDLLIPILHGKSVILVGDHRQLPPMYDLSKLNKYDFEGLDDGIINEEINNKYNELYTNCFFKSLFEKIPESYKTMLVQQYRCHEDIMNVFNHFYQGELKLGFSGQNNSKSHNIQLFSNGRYIIEPNKHVYFVDCKKNEVRDENSTSIYNIGEARVVVELIKKLNNFFVQNPEKEKLSIGVICTYGDQARKIKDIMKRERVDTNGFKTDVEKMIVSTVDDFQGDERDIIILTTVRNPEHPEKSNPGFILAYQRINVALSRARRLLVMVGNRRYLETKGIIDLPDVNGRGEGFNKPHFRVYEEIISTIEQYGRVIQDEDILEDKEAK